MKTGCQSLMKKHLAEQAKNQRMKQAFSLLGLLLLTIPLLRHIDFERRLEAADSAPKLVSTLMSVSSGLLCGLLGLTVLGFVCDAGKGYRSKPLFISMAALGVVWSFFYPVGWMLGIPLMVYPIARRFGAAPASTKPQMPTRQESRSTTTREP